MTTRRLLALSVLVISVSLAVLLFLSSWHAKSIRNAWENAYRLKATALSLQAAGAAPSAYLEFLGQPEEVGESESSTLWYYKTYVDGRLRRILVVEVAASRDEVTDVVELVVD